MSTVRHARTRSTKLAAPPARAVQPPPAFNGFKPGAASAVTKPSDVLPSPSLASFLTNVRLLDLDRLSDWPDINALTFATGTSAQGQKKRIQSVEWALFRLFDLWDPEETRNKLKPLFPPLDHVQSLNLRAALLRSLEYAKKTGALGRDAILRKTMLDECKGERMEEILAAFSSAVLKKVTAEEFERRGTEPTPVVELALKNLSYREERPELSTLVLVHRAALASHLEGKQAAAARYKDFADLLGIKERGLARRREQVHQGDAHYNVSTSDSDLAESRRILRSNWAGNERWLETLAQGDVSTAKDGLLQLPFDRVWRRVEQGRLAEVEESSPGLLEQLDARVRAQRVRLQRWQAFKQRNFKGQAFTSPTKSKGAKPPKQRGIDLGFVKHQELQIEPGTMPRKKHQLVLNEEHAGLVSQFKEELSALDESSADPMHILRPRRRPDRFAESTLSADAGDDDPISELSGLEDEEADQETDPEPVSFSPNPTAKRMPVRPRLTSDGWKTISTAAPSSDEEMEEETATLGRPNVPMTLARSPSPPIPTLQKSPVRSQPPAAVPVVMPDDESEEELPVPESPTQDAADEILASMEQASPTPIRAKSRHTLSLADRTRLTMARGSSLFLADEPEFPPTAMAAATATVTATVGSRLSSRPTLASPIEGIEEEDQEVDDLASRTRRSMAGFEKAKQKAQLDRRRSERRSRMLPRREGSFFPKVDEQTEDQSMIVEELGEDDMEAIFRSRPKIKASPPQSPAKEYFE